MHKNLLRSIILAAIFAVGAIWLVQFGAAPPASQGDLNVAALARMLNITLTSDAFQNGQPIPKKYSKEGENLSPPLKWSKTPAGTKELVLMVEDPDGTGGNFSHWIAWGISPDITSLPEGIKKDPSLKDMGNMAQGLNCFLAPGYDGPLPWPGSGKHHYMFRLFALDKRVQIPDGSFKELLQQQMYGHVIGQGLLVGTYERSK